jgi:hypothetical protein
MCAWWVILRGMQSERDKTTLGIGVLLVAAAVIGNVPLVGLAVFFIAWGRTQRRVEAFVGRLPAGSRPNQPLI